jgi:S-adenosylmethionine-diacylglycerol 3-amino-3-carboxypropyl transferase
MINNELMADWKNKIYYSQCWEDPDVLLEGLEIKKGDRIISITSGGCNTLALLLKDPLEVVAIDINPAQNYLFELKVLAIKYLSYEDLLAFLGVNSCDNRSQLFHLLEPRLSKGAYFWCKENIRLINYGIIHVGKLEKYFRLFSKYILPLAHSKKTIQSLFVEKTEKKQHNFYNNIWNTWRWRFLFTIYFSKRVTSTSARNKKLFKYVNTENISNHYFDNVKNSICNNPSKNFILHYIFTGKYDKKNLPLYLRRENVTLIRERLDRIKIVSDDLATFIKVNYGIYNKYNLSNIFENLSREKTSSIFADIVKHSGSNTRLVYVNHLVDRSFPDELSNKISHDLKSESFLNKKNTAPFYKKIHIDYIK